MEGWETGPWMIQDPELEEGEACYQGDGTSIDPDVALSYLDDKVQSILGHFQKDFEGGVTAENLGAKFGGYGSFLPTYQRSPSVWTQPKSPTRVQKPSTPRSPNYLPPEGIPHHSGGLPDVPFSHRNGANAPSSIHLLQNLKAPSGDGSIRQDALLSDKVGESHPGKPGFPSNKSGDQTDQRRIKVRIKVGSDTTTQKNVAIYSGLGLMSPSSAGNSPEESDGSLLEPHEIPDESLSRILQLMTSYPVSGVLLSPLPEDLFKLVRERKPSVDRESAATLKGLQNHSAVSVDEANPRNSDVLRVNQNKPVEKKANFEKSKTDFGMNAKEDKKNSGTEALECRLQSSNDVNCNPSMESVSGACESLRGVVRPPETIRELEKDVQVRKWEDNKDKMKGGRVGSTDAVKSDSLESISGQSGGKYDYRESKDRSAEKHGEHRVRSSKKDRSVDHGEGARRRGKKVPASFKADSDISESETVSKGGIEHLNQKCGPKSNSGEQDELRMYPAVNKPSLQGKNKSKGSQNSVKSDSNLAEENLRGVSFAAKDKLTLKKKKDVRKVADTRSEHLDMPKQSLDKSSDDKSSDDRSKNHLETFKEKHASADKSKERITSKKLINQVNSVANLKEAAADALPPAKGVVPETEQATPAPVLIAENWVCCDRCQTWRLLPYGTMPEDLPEKWVCSMLNWLPGMNDCNFSEDETTKALYALYQIPLPENQSNVQTEADKTINGVASGGGRPISQNHQNFDSNQMAAAGKKKHKFKEMPKSGGITDSIPSLKFNKNPQPRPVKSSSLKEVCQPQVAPNLINKSSVQLQNKASAVMAKPLNKRKNEHVVGDDADPMKKSKREPDQHVYGNMKKIKTEGGMDIDDTQISRWEIGRVGHDLTSDSPNKSVLKDKKKHKSLDSRSGGRENLQISGKKQKDYVQELPDKGSLDVNTCNKMEMSSKKRKFRDSQGSQGYIETPQSNGSDLHVSKVSVKEESSSTGFHRDKKSRVSHVDGKESRKNKDNDIHKRKGPATRILLPGNRENQIDKDVEKELRVKKYRAKLPSKLTMDDIESLRKDLGSDPLSMAATSSSSKVSDSRKTRGNRQEVKGSPEESVSSSPMRISHLNKVLPARMETVAKAESRLTDFPMMGSPRKSLDGNRNSESNHLATATNGKATSGFLPESFEHSVLDFRDSNVRDKSTGKSESGANRPSECVNGSFVGKDGDLVEQCSPCPTSVRVSEHSHSKERMKKNHFNVLLPQQISKRDSSLLPMDKDGMSSFNFEGVPEKVSSPKIHQDILDPNDNHNSKKETVIDQKGQKDKQDTSLPSKPVPVYLKGKFTDLRTVDSSIVGDLSKLPDEAANTHHQHRTNDLDGRNMADRAEIRNINAVAVAVASDLTATQVLKEAKGLRDYADRLKDSGFPFESNEAYFEAALKFLQGASCLEACNGEMNQMQTYSNTAKLCETCAHEYEKRQEMAAAALAYKCMEVAYMRVVYCKNSSAYRLLHDLQASLPSALHGESPSSSASDIDNLNNLMVDKSALSKGNGSQAGNHVIVPRNGPNLVRLLDFTKDVNSAMEASRKSQSALAAASVTPEDAQSKEGIVSVKRVIDFSFQDVEELIRLVRLACKAINRQGFNGNKE